MSTVSGYRGNGTELAGLLRQNNDATSYAAGRAGLALESANKDLMKAAAAGENSAELKSLAVKYGLLTEQEAQSKNVSSEAVMMAIKNEHEKRSRIMEMLNNISDAMDRTLRSIISKIGN